MSESVSLVACEVTPCTLPVPDLLNKTDLPNAQVLQADFRTGETRGARTLRLLVQSTKGETVRA